MQQSRVGKKFRHIIPTTDSIQDTATMIIAHCPITGVNLELEFKFGLRTIRVVSLHPLLSAQTSQLVTLSPTSAEDSRLLFLALTFKLHEHGFLELSGTPAAFDSRWISQELPHLQTFTQWAEVNSTNIRKDLLPIFRLDSESTSQNFQSWRQECQSIISTWDTMLDNSIARHIKREREAALAILSAPAHVKAKIAASPRVSRVQARLTFVRDSLESYSDMGISLIDFYLRVLAAPHTYEVIQLQRTKECFLDYLPDTTIEDYNDKDTCLRILDAAIVEKVGLANMLGMTVTPDAQNIAESIRTENSTYADGQRFTTSTDPHMQNALTFFSSGRPSTVPDLIVPDSEPRREDFPSNLGYQIALKLWRKSNEQ